MKLGYARISKTDTPLYLQEQVYHLREYGCENDAIFTEFKTGTVGHRPALNELVSRVGCGDEVVVWKLDRIGRSVEGIASLIHDLHLRGASLRTLGEGAENINTDVFSNTQDVRVFKLLARFKRTIDRERLEHNRSRRTPDRSHKSTLLLSRSEIEYARHVLSERTRPIKALCRELGISTPTLYQYLGPNGELRERGLRVMRVVNESIAFSSPGEVESANCETTTCSMGDGNLLSQRLRR